MKKSLCIIPILLASAGCGTIFNGTSQTITAQSSPDAAAVSTQPVTARYTTPASLELERKNSYTLTFEKEGYSPEQFLLQKKLQGGIVALDILFTALIGVVVDAATGAWYQLVPETATVVLTSTDGTGEPITVTISQDGDEFTFKASQSGVGVTAQNR